MPSIYSVNSIVLAGVNTLLEAESERGRPIETHVDGHPEMLITSMEPVVGLKYNWLFRRAPRLTGSVAVEAFIANENDLELVTRPRAIVAREGTRYAFGVLSSMVILNDVLHQTGLDHLVTAEVDWPPNKHVEA